MKNENATLEKRSKKGTTKKRTDGRVFAKDAMASSVVR
jgi:hypothetical protein